MTYDLNAPKVGFYKMKMARGGPFVPVRIFLAKRGVDGNLYEWDERGGPCVRVAALNGAITRMDRVWPWCAHGGEIAREEYESMLDRRDAALLTGQGPEATPTETVDFNRMPVPEF